jgi:hypothetical protein
MQKQPLPSSSWATAALPCRQANEADELAIMFGEQQCILRPNPAAVAPLGIEF